MAFRGNNRHTNTDALNSQPISIQMRELSSLLRQRNQSEGKGVSWFQGQASFGGSGQSLACFSLTFMLGKDIVLATSSP